VLQPQVPCPQAAIPAAGQQQRHHTTLCWPGTPPLCSCRTLRDLFTSARSPAAAAASSVPTPCIIAAASGLIPAPCCTTAEAPVDRPRQAAVPCCAAAVSTTPSTAQHVLRWTPETDLQCGADPAAVPAAHSAAVRVPGSSWHTVGGKVIKQDGARGQDDSHLVHAGCITAKQQHVGHVLHSHTSRQHRATGAGPSGR
jgi:hypothetical protein